MFVPHPSAKLAELFKLQPYQGVSPERATFLFVGLDANYDAGLETSPSLSSVLEYHSDGVAFWAKHGVHHPFLLKGYSGGGRRYHRNFSRIGFTPAQAALVSFVELLHVPTVGRNVLEPKDLSPDHLAWLDAVIQRGSARHVFMSNKVAQLMRATHQFSWMARTPDRTLGPLGIWSRFDAKTVYSHLHFSVYGKFEERLISELIAIRGLASTVTAGALA